MINYCIFILYLNKCFIQEKYLPQACLWNLHFENLDAFTKFSLNFNFFHCIKMLATKTGRRIKLNSNSLINNQVIQTKFK